MNSKDPKLTALQFNECINNQDIEGLAGLMTEDHTFIDREGKVHKPKEFMIESWKSFFKMFPHYKNIFTSLESREDFVTIIGHAFWSEEQPHDSVIWTARIENDLVAEWRVYENTKENKKGWHIDCWIQ